MCDQSVHIHCLRPKLTVVPKDSFYCTSCIKCVTCKKKLPALKIFTDGKWLGSERLCDKCHQAAQSDYQEIEDNTCQKCLKVTDGDTLVQCEKCQQWHCVPCTELTPAQLADEETMYICESCV